MLPELGREFGRAAQVVPLRLRIAHPCRGTCGTRTPASTGRRTSTISGGLRTPGANARSIERSRVRERSISLELGRGAWRVRLPVGSCRQPSECAATTGSLPRRCAPVADGHRCQLIASAVVLCRGSGSSCGHRRLRMVARAWSRRSMSHQTDCTRCLSCHQGRPGTHAC